MALQRELIAMPSDSGSLQMWQLSLQDHNNRIHQQAYDKKQLLGHTIQELPKRAGQEALEFAVQIVDACSEGQAYAQAQEILRPKRGVMSGAATTCILQWRFDSESLWRGISDNTKLARLARSMLRGGFE